MANKALQRRNLKDLVAIHVRDMILSGDARPGTKIDQDTVADVLGISKLPVREALIQLEHEGLVNNRVRRGVFVADIRPNDVRDHYYMYGLASGIAAERATPLLTDEDINELEVILVEMDSSRDAERLEQLNIEFHSRLNKLGGSGRLLAILRTLANSLPGRFYEFTEGWAQVASVQHWEILDAIKQRDGELTNRAVTSHLRTGGDFAVKILQTRGFWEPDSVDANQQPVSDRDAVHPGDY